MNKNRGISIIEILVVIFIVSFTLTTLLGLATFSLRVSHLIKETTEANNLVQEIIEAVRSFRDTTNWEVNGLKNYLGVYHLEKSNALSAKWVLLPGQQTINGFTQEIVLEKVSRDPATFNIEKIYNLSNDDPGTRKVTATIFWKNKEVKIITYLTDWKQ